MCNMLGIFILIKFLPLFSLGKHYFLTVNALGIKSGLNRLKGQTIGFCAQTININCVLSRNFGLKYRSALFVDSVSPNCDLFVDTLPAFRPAEAA